MEHIQTVEFTVEGEPKGKGRPRFTKAGHAYTPKATKEYELRIRQACWRAMAEQKIERTDRDVHVEIFAHMPVPKSWTVRQKALAHAGVTRPRRPDLDNVLKAVLDGANGIAYDDDAQVHSIRARKRYVFIGERPCLFVKMSWSAEQA